MTIQRIPGAYSIADLWAAYVQQLATRQEIPGSGLADGMTIEALPSWYAGVTFRSKLEADWAATLDSLNIRWEYEPETVTLPSGARYIPDFWLPDIRTWLEVKGTGVPRIEKAIEFGAVRSEAAELVLIGHPPKPYQSTYDPEQDVVLWWWAEQRRAWRHHGHPAWTNASGRTTWLTRCRDCDRGTWFTFAECRACGGWLRGTHAYDPGDSELLFIDSAALPAPGAQEAS